MKQLSTAEARDNFCEIINQVAYGKDRIVLTRRGKAICALVSLEDLERLKSLEQK